MNSCSSLSWKVYIIESTCGKLYTGITKDLRKRFDAHKYGKKGAKFFHFSNPEKIVFQEDHPDRSQASKREAVIKKLTKKEKLLLVASFQKNFNPS